MSYNLFVSRYFDTAFNTYTIDSFRPRYSNSHVILEEILNVCNLVEAGVISDFYLSKLLLEACDVIQKDVIVRAFPSKNHSLLLEKLKFFFHNKQKDENDSTNVNEKSNSKIINLIQFLKAELNYYRKEYLKLIIKEILASCDKRLKKNKYNEDDIRNLLNSFISECLYQGVSFKSLKESLCFPINCSKKNIRDAISRITNRRSFVLYLLLLNVDKEISNFFVNTFNNAESPFNITKEWPIKEIYIPAQFRSKKKKRSKFLVIQLKDKIQFFDKYGGLLYLRTVMEPVVNLAHIFYPNERLQFFDKGLVYDYSLRRYQEANYISLVNYNNYRKISERDIVFKIGGCLRHGEDIKSVINGSAAYLDISLNEYKIINKYLNAWISIEVLFNTLKKESGSNDGKTIHYLFKYVPKILGIFFIYKIINYLFRRVLENASNNLRTNFLNSDKPDITLFIRYIRDDVQFQTLLNDLALYPDLCQSLKYYVDNIFLNKKLLTLIEKHRDNISIHLQRLYRIRNMIVHGGENIVKDDGLYNISTILMLSINCQEYATELIEHISEISIKDNDKKKYLKILDVYETFDILYEIITQKLSHEKFTEDDLEKLMKPLTFLS